MSHDVLFLFLCVLFFFFFFNDTEPTEISTLSLHDALPISIDEATAERAKLKLGQQMIVAGSAPAKRYTIVGITQFGGGQSFGGAGAAILTLPEAQRVVGEPGRYDQLDVAAGPGVTPSQLRERIRAALPSTVEVRT